MRLACPLFPIAILKAGGVASKSLGASCGVMLVMRLPKRSHFNINPRKVRSSTGLGPRRPKADIIGDLFAKAIGRNHLGKICRRCRQDIARKEGIAARLKKIML